MKGFVSILLLAIMRRSAMTPNDIKLESLNCGVNRFSQASCLLQKNCLYVEWFVVKVQTELSLCLSLNELMTNYVRNSDRFLADNPELNAVQITRENFCSVMMQSQRFLGLSGKLTSCTYSSNAKY